MITELDKKFACIADGVVYWVFNSEMMPEYSEKDIQAIECDDTVKIGWIYKDSIFTSAPVIAPPELSLNDAKTRQLNKVNAACKAAILAGFEYGGYHYPFQLTDQANLTGSVVASMIPSNASNASWVTSFWSATNIAAPLARDQGWSLVDYTATQIQAVGEASIVFKLTAIKQLVGLSVLISACTDLTGITGITWDNRVALLSILSKTS